MSVIYEPGNKPFLFDSRIGEASVTSIGRVLETDDRDLLPTRLLLVLSLVLASGLLVVVLLLLVILLTTVMSSLGSGKVST